MNNAVTCKNITGGGEISPILERLQDEESRELFDCRYQSYLDHNWSRLLRLPEIACKYSGLTGPRPLQKAEHLACFSWWEDIVIFGAGNAWPGAFVRAKCFGYNTVAVIDNSPKKLQNVVSRLRQSEAPETLLGKYRGLKIVISSPKYETAIYRQLLDMGIDGNLIFSAFFPDTGRLEPNHFSFPFLQPVENEIYVDAGAHDTETIQSFAQFTSHRYQKIYAMEPDPAQVEVIEKQLGKKGLENVQVIPKGAWSKNTELLFSSNGAMGTFGEEGNVRLPVTSIDSMVGNDKVTFIKMDIEGSELEALRGAKQTIRECKPRLAICLYHKPEDIVEIPLWLAATVPEYKFYIRHLYYMVAETVLFATL